jgi:hypothetical protein
VAFPVLLVFEAAGPVVEIAGYAVMFTTFLLGWMSWEAFLAFLAAAVGMGMLLSASALLLEEVSFHLYGQKRHLGVLLAATVFDNFGFRQLTAFWRARGVVEWLFRRRGEWGAMPRTATWQAPHVEGAQGLR